MSDRAGAVRSRRRGPASGRDLGPRPVGVQLPLPDEIVRPRVLHRLADRWTHPCDRDPGGVRAAGSRRCPRRPSGRTRWRPRASRCGTPVRPATSTAERWGCPAARPGRRLTGTQPGWADRREPDRVLSARRRRRARPRDPPGVVTGRAGGRHHQSAAGQLPRGAGHRHTVPAALSSDDRGHRSM
jgi:hypothetical protein